MAATSGELSGRDKGRQMTLRSAGSLGQKTNSFMKQNTGHRLSSCGPGRP